MRDHKTAQAAVAPQTPDFLQDFALEQLAGNQFAQAAMESAEDESSTFNFLDLDAVSTDMAEHDLFFEDDVLSTDATLADHADLLDSPASLPIGSTDIGKGALSRTFARSSDDDVFGRHIRSAKPGVDLANKSVSLNLGYAIDAVGDNDSKSAFNLALQADATGKFDAAAAAQFGEYGAGGSAMVDVSGGGQLQAVGLGAMVELPGVGGSLRSSVQLNTPDVKGKTVSRASGVTTASDAKFGAVGTNAGATDLYSEAFTFANQREAEEHGKALAAGERSAVSEMTAEDLLALPEGARASYVHERSAKAGGSFVVAGGGEATSKRTVDIGARQGDVVELTITDHGDVGAKAGVTGGLLSADYTTRLFSDDVRTFTVDLADPEQAEAFARFQATGDTDGLTFLGGSSFDGSSSESKGVAPGMAAVEGASRSSGLIDDGGRVSDVERGAYTGDGTNDWSFDGALATAAEVAAAVTPYLGLDLLDDVSRGYTRAGEHFRGRQSAAGTAMGAESGRSDVLTGRADGETLLVQTQVADFDDQQQNARFLEDQMDLGTDQKNLNVEVPGHATTDREWMLESVVSSQGVQNIEDVLAGKGALPCESVESTAAWMASRAAYQGSEREAADLRSAVADSGMQGEDSLECARAMAGAENVEQYVSLKGDDVWMSRMEHEANERAITAALRLARMGQPSELNQLRVDAERRRGRVADTELNPEVPRELRIRELDRIDTALRTMGGE